MDNSSVGIYIHIPFCKRKCNYCDFYSVECIELVDRYISFLEKEFELRKKIILDNFKRIKTLYIGGGTPSILSCAQIESLFSVIFRFIPQNLSEITFELNPESTDINKISVLRDMGVKRVSVGVQSAVKKELEFLGRIHDFDDFLNIYEKLKDFSVNIDLIYGIPRQNFSDFRKSIERITDLNVNHISIYALEIHENTPFYGRVTTDDELQRDIYERSVEFLEKKGYMHYEISNFALDGFQSIHNLNYWNRGDYLGFGPSAVSCIGNKRWKNISSINSYMAAINNGKIELEYFEELSDKDIMNEKLILAMRKRDGIAYDTDIFNYFKNEIDRKIAQGYLEKIYNGVRLKKEYIFVFNKIISEIIR